MSTTEISQHLCVTSRNGKKFHHIAIFRHFELKITVHYSSKCNNSRIQILNKHRCTQEDHFVNRRKVSTDPIKNSQNVPEKCKRLQQCKIFITLN